MNEYRALVTQPANEHLAPAPFAALQQQEVTTLENVEERAAEQRQPAAAPAGPARPSYAHPDSLQRGSFPSRRIAMPLKNSNTVAVERRTDLASLFCMIGRHGPAVALAVIAMLSVLAGFIIYRTVRGKRRKATAAAADGDSKSREAERDASVIQQSPEESQSSVESTDVSDEGSEVKESVDLIQSDLKIRQRRVAAAEKTPPPYSPPHSDVQVPDNKHPTDTEEVAAVWDSEMYAEEVSHSLLNDAEMVLEDVADSHQGETDDAIKDVLEEFHDEERCTKEPEPINDEHHEEEEEVLKTECQECEDVTMDKDVSIKTVREEEDNFQAALNSPVCFEQTPHMRENSDDDRLHDRKTTNDTENPDSYSVNDRLAPEEETPDEETNPQSTQQEQCDHVMDKGTTPIQGNDWDEDGRLAGEEDITEDHLNKLTAVKFDAQVIELQEENGLMCDQEDSVLYDGGNQEKVEMETSQEIENNGNATTVQLDEEEEVCDPQAIRNEALAEASVAAVPDKVAYDGENVTTAILTEAFDKASVTADPGTVENLPSAVVEDIYCPHLSSISQDQQSDQTKKNEVFSQAPTGAAPVMIEDVDPPVCQIRLSLCDKGILSTGVGEESGISSMTVSPDAGDEFDVIVEDMVFPVMDCDLHPEAENSLFADDAAISFHKEDTAGMDSEHTGWTNYESLVANEDMFGHEIEDSYHRAVDQFMAQITDNVTSFIDELEKQSDVNVFVEVTEKKAAGNAEKKEEIKEEEEDYEKTEISIMEATMDHNEWIMDSNYQALPWMNLCTPSFTQDRTKTNQLPAEESQSSSAVIDTCLATTDIPSSTEVKQTSDETMENSKKVVAVQPMPQNVNVTFRVHYFTQSPYQTVAVTGSRQELGNWKGFIPLDKAKDGHWAVVVSLPAESHVEWKFVVVDKGDVCRWEECGNRLLDTGFGDDLLVHKFWGRL